MIRRAMILAAGFGTRLRPLTNTVAKPMVPVCNRPLIGWAIDALLDAGVCEFVVNLHHAPDSLRDWVPYAVGSRGEVHFSEESEILGTGGGIRHARALLEGRGEFAVLNGDTIQRPPLKELAARRRDHDSLASLLLRVPPSHDRFTPVWFDGEHITGFGEGTGEALMFSGCHVISDRIFELLPERPFSGIVEDVYIKTLQRSDGERLTGVVVDDAMWFDVGTPRRYLDASLALLKMMVEHAINPPDGSSLSASSLVASDSAAQLESSVLGVDVRADADALIHRSVVLDRAWIEGDARVRGSIIGPGVVIPPGTTVENAFVCRNDGSDAGEPALGDTVLARPIDEERPMRLA